MSGQDLARRDDAERDDEQLERRPGWVVPVCFAAGLSAVLTAMVAWPDGDVPVWLTATTWAIITLAGLLLIREALGGGRS